jgi:hypothetical protein
VDRPCPRCAKPCPDNEYTAYGRHEDCTPYTPGHNRYASQGLVPIDHPTLGQQRKGDHQRRR